MNTPPTSPLPPRASLLGLPVDVKLKIIEECVAQDRAYLERCTAISDMFFGAREPATNDLVRGRSVRHLFLVNKELSVLTQKHIFKSFATCDIRNKLFKHFVLPRRGLLLTELRLSVEDLQPNSAEELLVLLSQAPNLTLLALSAPSAKALFGPILSAEFAERDDDEDMFDDDAQWPVRLAIVRLARRIPVLKFQGLEWTYQLAQEMLQHFEHLVELSLPCFGQDEDAGNLAGASQLWDTVAELPLEALEIMDDDEESTGYQSFKHVGRSYSCLLRTLTLHAHHALPHHLAIVDALSSSLEKLEIDFMLEDEEDITYKLTSSLPNVRNITFTCPAQTLDLVLSTLRAPLATSLTLNYRDMERTTINDDSLAYNPSILQALDSCPSLKQFAVKLNERALLAAEERWLASLAEQRGLQVPSESIGQVKSSAFLYPRSSASFARLHDQSPEETTQQLCDGVDRLLAFVAGRLPRIRREGDLGSAQQLVSAMRELEWERLAWMD